MASNNQPPPSATTTDNTPTINFINPSTLPQPLHTLVESPHLYRPFGFHPIHPGDLIASRFLVLNKLGHGRNSTVWLCLDHQARRRPYKAIRIFHVRASRLHHGDEVFFIWQKNDVLGISEKIAYEKLRLAVPLDSFYINDGGNLNGSRGGLVYPVLGPRVDDEGYLRYLAEKSGRSIWEVKRRVCYMVADAVESMHGLGLCHGDVRPENMLFEVRGLERLGVEEVRRVYGGVPRGYKHGLPVLDGEGGLKGVRPEYLVLKAELDYRLLDDILVTKPPAKRKHITDYHTEDDDAEIPKAFLIDMGAAWRFNELDSEPWYYMKAFYDKATAPGGMFHRRDFVRDRKDALPKEYTAPEVLFGLQDPGPESEVWSLGCTIVKIMLGRIPFCDGKVPTEWDVQERLTYESFISEPAENDDKWVIVKLWQDLLGPLPEAYKEKLGGSLILEPAANTRAGSGGHDTGFLERDVMGLGMKDRNAAQLVHLLRGMFAWDAAKRLTVTEVLNHPWFQTWDRRQH